MNGLEPEWWAEARRMYAEGARCADIAFALNKDRSSIHYVFHRDARRAQCAEYYKANPYKRPNKKKSPEYRKWVAIRKLARDEWRVDGCVKSVHEYYRRYECEQSPRR